MEESFVKLRTGANGKTRKVLIPTAHMLNGFVRRLPFGKASDIATMKKEFAREAGADLTCPVTARQHLHTLCESAVRAHMDGGEVLPVWRLIGAVDATARRVPGAAALIGEMRAKEQI